MGTMPDNHPAKAVLSGDDSDTAIYCAQCGEPAREDLDNRKPCPKCGSTARHIRKNLFGTLSFRSDSAGVVANPLWSVVDRSTETRNVDFKAPMRWSKDDRCSQLELLKDLVALANSPGGGYLVIGRNQPNFTSGTLTEEQARSFDTTEVNKLLHKFTEPPHECMVTCLERNAGGDRVVVIEVPEFVEEPILFTKDGQCAAHSNLHFNSGYLYMRSPKAASEPIRDTNMMRDLLGRALKKKGTLLVEQITAVLAGRAQVEAEPAVDPYTDEISEEQSVYFKLFYPVPTENCFVSLIARPVRYEPDRIPLTELGSVPFRLQTRYRGASLPIQIDPPFQNFEDGIQKITNISYLREAYRIRTSALLSLIRFNPDDIRVDDNPHYSETRRIGILWMMKVIAGMVFLGRNLVRLALSHPMDELAFEITMGGMENRILINDAPELFFFAQGGPCLQPIIRFPTTISASVLEVKAGDIIVDYVQKALWLLNQPAFAPVVIRNALRDWVGDTEPRAFPKAQG